MKNAADIQVGYGRVDIMPEGSIELGGYGNGPFRKSENVLDPLFATCIAITDENDKTLLLITTDLLHATADMVASARVAITEATGIPSAYIMISATHTHAGPDVYNPGPQTVQSYIRRYVQQLPKAVLAALEDRKPAKAFAGRTELPGMNFVRHYRMKDGSFAGSNFGSWKSGIAGHTSEADRNLQLIRFTREEGKDILMMNWQAHPCLNSGSKRLDISADFIGVTRSYLEVTTGCHFAYFQGACGDLGTSSKIPEDHAVEDTEQYAKELGDAAIRLLDELAPVATGEVRTVRRQVTCTIDHATDHRVPEAKALWELWLSGKAPQEAWRQARELGFNSPYTARTLIERACMPPTMDQEMNAICVGELAFATAPYEMFSVSGEFIKENSPFPMTFILAYCNGSNSYIASRLAFSHGCYEVDTRKFAEGTAEMLADTLVEMLGQIKT